MKAAWFPLGAYERWGEEILHLLSQERRSSVIADVLDGARRYHRDWIARVFAPQLAQRGNHGDRCGDHRRDGPGWMITQANRTQAAFCTMASQLRTAAR